ncbi:MAG: helix-turn-helix transcriptional regulator [Pelolinea sp.]|nr:helix-turn-helix transcriptional regulator [Pelolinea sp.]
MLNYVNKMVEFSEFIQRELSKRGWSQADFARRSGMTTGGVSMLLNQTRKPSPDTLKIIAQVFDIPIETIFRIAGLLPPVPESTIQKDQLNYLYDNLGAEGQKELVNFAHWLREKNDGYSAK